MVDICIASAERAVETRSDCLAMVRTFTVIGQLPVEKTDNQGRFYFSITPIEFVRKQLTRVAEFGWIDSTPSRHLVLLTDPWELLVSEDFIPELSWLTELNHVMPCPICRRGMECNLKPDKFSGKQIGFELICLNQNRQCGWRRRFVSTRPSLSRA
jgi:hypothetical protein